MRYGVLMKILVNEVILSVVIGMLVILLLSGCNLNKPKYHPQFVTYDGIRCSQGARSSLCGYNLWECEDGYERQCATNVKE